MSQLVFLLEERSAQAMLEVFVPRIVPQNITLRFLSFEGKQDLEGNILRKIRGYRVPGARFVVLRDQDSGDCRQAKQRLSSLCIAAGREDAVVRIACRELESWYLSDLGAVAAAFDRPHLVREADKARFRDPDMLEGPSKVLARISHRPDSAWRP